MMAKLINELDVVDLASAFVQHYAPISAAFLSINPKIHGELLPTAPWPHADVHRNNPNRNLHVNHHQNPNCNLHVTLLKTQTQISHAPPPQIKTQTHIATFGSSIVATMIQSRI